MGYLIWKSYNFNLDATLLFAAIRKKKNCFFLDSGINNSLGRYSFLGFEPVCILKAENKIPFDELRRILNRHKIKRLNNVIPFMGGAVGFFSYDFGMLLENKLKPLYSNDSGLPDFHFSFYDAIIAIDHLKNKLFVLALNNSSFKRTIRMLSEIDFKKPDIVTVKKKCNKLVSNFGMEDYLKTIKKAKGYIEKGDIYQVNLSQKFTARNSLDAYQIYQQLRKVSPACFSAYLDCGDFQVISSSPERFLSLRNRIVQTRPMKGTRARSSEQKEDISLRNELINSSKDKAELMMIIDLMRNDLGRVCEYASVKVKSLRNLERYKTVFQTTATIEGTLHKDMDGIDLIKACFPGGSITGCPKIRAMEIINELEPGNRGIYTGSLGYLSFCGNLDFNILIRTILKQNDNIYFSVGGGIVADSRPKAEYEETLIKAKGIFQAIS